MLRGVKSSLVGLTGFANRGLWTWKGDLEQY